MRDPGKITAAIEVLTDFEARRVPLKICLADWARTHRFAGAKDRAWISGLCLDALRCKSSLGYRMNDTSLRSVVLGCLRYSWNWPVDQIAEAASEEPHGPGALHDDERAQLSGSMELMEAAPAITGDYPDWLSASLARTFDQPVEEAMAFTHRAPVDLRTNCLKINPEKALKSVEAIKAEESPLLKNALRILPPSTVERASSVEAIPAYGKGWVEIQDLGSQIAAAAAGDIVGKQVLDFCAGAGGKTLALAALAQNTGQIFAWDANGRRLAPIFERIRRAGARNIQVRSPSDGGSLDDLKGKMDLVFVDAPCTGTGTWRRRPDTKWRLTTKQLEIRMAEQDQVLTEAASYVRPDGRLVYVTCSFLAEENEDRLAVFRENHPSFNFCDTLGAVHASNLLTEEGHSVLNKCKTPDGALRMTPLRCSTDGFFISVLQKIK